MSKAFLSHSSKDKQLVEKVANKLGKDYCIYDKYTFEISLPTLDEILINLNSTDVFVFFISDHSLESDWVKKELKVARELISENIISKFYPVLIDAKVTHRDDRLPKWITKHYNLKPIFEPYLIVKKIQKQLRMSLQKVSAIKLKEELFVGRNDIIEEFETKYLTIENIKPSCIVISGIEGIGRRTTLKRCLLKVGAVKNLFSPLVIYLDSKQSIEDFIIQIQDLEGKEAIELLMHLQNSNLEAKIEVARNLLFDISRYNEKLQIVDSGCIIKPTKQISQWFLDVIDNERFKNELIVCVISRFRPTSNTSFLKSKNIVSIHVPEMPKSDVEKLFVRYSNLLELNLQKDHTLAFTNLLNGIPSQVFYCVELIKNEGIEFALRNSKDIVGYGETQVFYLIELVKKDQDNLDFLILISQFEFVSFEFLNKVIESKDEIYQNFEKLYILGIIDLIGSAGEYIKVHYSVADYIRRSRFPFKESFKEKLRECIKNFLKADLGAKSNEPDISELLINVQSALNDGQKIPEHYYLPSFVLKSIINKYYQKDYKEVINLTAKILESNNKFDKDIIREIKYWQCLAYARKSDIKFESIVENIDGADYFFLWGFYYRIKRDWQKAENNLRKALQISPNFNRAKRELVNVFLINGNFSSALETARENFENGKTNAFHIQAYFMCLIRKRLDDKEKNILEELLNKMDRSHDPKSKEILVTMKGEYAYYIKKSYVDAISLLENAIKISEYKSYPVKALIEIHESNGSRTVAESMRNRYYDILFSTYDDLN